MYIYTAGFQHRKNGTEVLTFLGNWHHFSSISAIYNH